MKIHTQKPPFYPQQKVVEVKIYLKLVDKYLYHLSGLVDPQIHRQYLLLLARRQTDFYFYRNETVRQAEVVLGNCPADAATCNLFADQYNIFFANLDNYIGQREVLGQ